MTRKRCGALATLAVVGVLSLAGCSNSEGDKNADLNQLRDKIDDRVEQVASEVGCTDEPTRQSSPIDALPTMFECTAHDQVVIVAVDKDLAALSPEQVLKATQQPPPNVTLGDGYAWIVSDQPRSLGNLIPGTIN